MLKVYVAGPYTGGDQVVNVRNAVLVSNHLFNLGFAPYCPHLNAHWHAIAPRPYEDWMTLDLEYLGVCDVLLRMEGESPGADREVRAMLDLGRPVCYSISELCELFGVPV